ncbi:hypothetical protein PRNO82_04947 (plasmid) [Planktothrix rubescens]|nr:hypothetical protein PRNO82_04947 [Planktothrix rubescens]
MITIIPESVTGGDAFIASYNGTKYKFNARWIEAPLAKNSFYEWEVSRNHLCDLIYIYNQKLTVIPWSSFPSPDANNTNLPIIYSDWFLQGYDIQLKMMQLGSVKFRYSLLSEVDNFSNQELSKMARVLKLQNFCKSHQIGLWRNPLSSLILN